MKSFFRSRDRREAFIVLCNRYLGMSIQYNLVSTAEARLHCTFYSGDSRRFSVDIFVDILQGTIRDKESVTGLMDGMIKYDVYFER